MIIPSTNTTVAISSNLYRRYRGLKRFILGMPLVDFYKERGDWWEMGILPEREKCWGGCLDWWRTVIGGNKEKEEGCLCLDVGYLDKALFHMSTHLLLAPSQWHAAQRTYLSPFLWLPPLHLSYTGWRKSDRGETHGQHHQPVQPYILNGCNRYTPAGSREPVKWNSECRR